MATRKTTAHEPQVLRLRLLDIQAEPHELGGITLHIEAMDEHHERHTIELEMMSQDWWKHLARALGQGAA